MEVKKGDFIELDYTGKLEDGTVFDTTVAEVAKSSSIGQPEHAYKPLKICVGKGHLLQGLDDRLEGKEAGKQYTLQLSPEEGFGKKSTRMIQLIATSKFTKDNITPFPGLQVNVDGIMGIVRSVTGGRTIVDFNHPLAGRTLQYDITIRRVISDDSEKVAAMIELIGLKAGSKVEAGSAEIETEHELPLEFSEKFSADIRDCIPSITEVRFTAGLAKQPLSTGQ